MTQARFALAVGRSDRQIRSYIQAGMPRRKDGKIDRAKAEKWIAENVKPTGRAADGAPSGRAYWEEFRVRQIAQQEELELRRQQGKLVEVDMVSRVHERCLTTAKVQLEQFPERALGSLPPNVSGKIKRSFLENMAEMIEDVLQTLSDLELEAIDGEERGDADSEAAEVGSPPAAVADPDPRLGRRKRAAPKRDKQQPGPV